MRRVKRSIGAVRNRPSATAGWSTALWLLASALLAIVCGLSACGGDVSPSPASSEKTYTSAEYGFTIRYGPGWGVAMEQPGPNPDSFTLVLGHWGSGPGGIPAKGAVKVLVNTWSEGNDPALLLRYGRRLTSSWKRSANKKDQSITIVQRFEPSTLGDHDALLGAYLSVSSVPGVPARYHELYVLTNGKRLYTVGLEAPDDGWDEEREALEAVALSFTMLEAPPRP